MTPPVRARARRRRGTQLLEAVLWIPLLVAFLFGAVELARVTYTYYTLQKMLYSLARLAGTRQGVNFCDDADATIASLKEYVLRGGIEEGAEAILPNLEASQIRIRIERYIRETDELQECDCSETGCDLAYGGLSPEYLVVSVPEGYPVRLAFPGLNLDPIPLRPQVRVPFGGT